MASTKFDSEWEGYPVQHGQNVPLCCNTKHIREKLNESRERIFVERDESFQLWLVDGEGLIEKRTVQDVEALSELGQEQRATVYLISQKHSWSRLRVTYSTFCRILALHKVFPPFFNIIHSYGFRTRDETETWDCFYRSITADSIQTEICYNLRYFERNGRVGEYPWSLRQTAVYQQLDISTGRATWILLSPSEAMKEALVSCTTNHEGFHLILVSVSLRNWREFVDSLDMKLQKLEEMSCFSDAELDLAHDYAIDFSTRQELELLRRKLLKASALLDSTTNIIRGLSYSDAVSEVEYCKSRVKVLTQRCEGTSKLLSNILEYRRVRAIAQASEASRKTLNAMNIIAHEMETESKAAQKGATTVKVLTFIATMYLPVSVVASIFSSNLVNEEKGRFSLATEFWKFVIVTLGLMVVTYGVTQVMERKLRGRDMRKTVV